MTPTGMVSRAELEERLDRMRSDFISSQLQQDTAFNMATAKMREDFRVGIETIRGDLRDFVTEKYLTARLSPVQNVAYGALTSVVAFLTAIAAYRFMHP